MMMRERVEVGGRAWGGGLYIRDLVGLCVTASTASVAVD